MRTETTLTLLSVGALVVLAPRSAAAECSDEGKAYGDFWIERSGTTCDCLIRQQQYTCATSGGFREQGSAETIATVSGDCDKACEDLDEYDAAVQKAIDNWTPGEGYGCDTVFTDNDQDGFGACIDEDDNDPRVWVKIDASETHCDGVDNDNDGTVDDGFTGCSEDHDHKRAAAPPTKNVSKELSTHLALRRMTVASSDTHPSVRVVAASNTELEERDHLHSVAE